MILLLLALQAATLVSADTGGMFYTHGPDTLRATNRTWVSRDSAPAMPDCVYSGLSQRMLARDSMRVTIGVRGRLPLWSGTLRPGDKATIGATWPLPSGRRFTLLDIRAPASPCGVNAGQVWFTWRFER